VRFLLAFARFWQRDHAQAADFCEAELTRPNLTEPSRSKLLTLTRAAQLGLSEKAEKRD
jgi:cytochrome c-type biogenesis protein CcmH/NrfG